MHAVKDEKGACMQCRKKKEHACSEGLERSMHAVKEEKVAYMQ